MKRTKEVWAQALTADESQFVAQTLLVQLTLETRNVTFVFVTMVSKGMALCAKV